MTDLSFQFSAVNPDFLCAVLDAPACAVFIKESRMNPEINKISAYLSIGCCDTAAMR
jgi:hypothetical protein